jgi:hypothetical protein
MPVEFVWSQQTKHQFFPSTHSPAVISTMAWLVLNVIASHPSDRSSAFSESKLALTAKDVCLMRESGMSSLSLFILADVFLAELIYGRHNPIFGCACYPPPACHIE